MENAYFDFRKMITPTLVKVLHIVGIVLLALLFVMYLYLFITFGGPWYVFVLTEVMVLLGYLFMRLGLELMVVIFNIYNELKRKR